MVWRKHGACEEDDAVRILMIGAERLAHQVFDVTADFGHRTAVLEPEVVVALDGQVFDGATTDKEVHGGVRESWDESEDEEEEAEIEAEEAEEVDEAEEAEKDRDVEEGEDCL